MKHFTLMMATLLVMLGTPVLAKDADPTAPATKTEKVFVDVNGLVCDFCARALEKVFGEKEEVSAIHVDLDSKVVTIAFVEDRRLDDETITTLVTDAGYNVAAIRDEPELPENPEVQE